MFFFSGFLASNIPVLVMGSPYKPGSILQADEYVCSLPADVRKLALLDLGEDEVTRTKALHQMRENLKNHPVISGCRQGKLSLIKWRPPSLSELTPY